MTFPAMNLIKHIFQLSFFLLITISVNAQCSITDVDIQTSECDDSDRFSATINFNFDEVGTLGFQVLGNGAFYGTFQYEDLPISIDGLNGNCQTPYEFIIRDLLNPTCSNFGVLGPVCCDVKCELKIDDIIASECINNMFDLSFKTEISNATEDSVLVKINGMNIGIYPGGQEITIPGLQNLEIGNNTLTICGTSNEECCDSKTFLNACECALTDINSKIVDCNINDSLYFVEIDFAHIATTDSFQLGYSEGGNNNFLGVFAYDDLPVEVGPIFMSDEAREIFIVDKDDFFCFSNAYLGVINDCNIECQIYNVFAESYDCGNEQYYIDVEFDTEDIEGYEFQVIVDNVVYGTFTYGESSYKVGPVTHNCQSAPIVVIQDASFSLCKDFYIFDGPICCGQPCDFTELSAKAECTPNGIEISATYSNPFVNTTSEIWFKFEGQDYGPFMPPMGTANFNVGMIENGTYNLAVFVDGIAGCATSTQLTINCESPVECEISNLMVEKTECNNNEQFFVEITFDYPDEIQNSWNILVNGNSYDVFEYGTDGIKLGPLNGDCTTIYQFEIISEIDNECRAVYEFTEAVCCGSECEIRDIAVENIECKNGNVTKFLLNFIYEDVEAATFNMFINGQPYGNKFNYMDLPITIEDTFPSTFELLIIDSENDSCSATMEVMSDCDTPMPCILDEGEFELIECDEDSYTLAYNMFYQTENDSFIVTNSLGLSSIYSYNELPIQISGLPVGPNIEFLFQDHSDEECKIFRSYQLAQCETSTIQSEWNSISIANHINLFHFKNTSKTDIQVNIYSINGHQIHSERISKNNQFTIKNDQFNSGIYLVSLTDGSYRKTFKFLRI